jgi:hypothetical protein
MTFVKHYPITEAEFREYKELQRKSAKNLQEEIARPDAVLPLDSAQREKEHILFTPSNDPELQKQSFTHFLTIVDKLKKKVEEQQRPTPMFTEKPPLSKTSYVQKRANRLVDALGTDAWNNKDELLVAGVPIPDSNKSELLDYMTSNWQTKYLDKQPVGASHLLELVKAKDISASTLGKTLRTQLKSPIKGFAKLATQATPVKLKRLAAKKFKANKIQAGFQLLEDGRHFNRLIRQ